MQMLNRAATLLLALNEYARTWTLTEDHTMRPRGAMVPVGADQDGKAETVG